jgi:hypothetical protein
LKFASCVHFTNRILIDILFALPCFFFCYRCWPNRGSNSKGYFFGASFLCWVSVPAGWIC